MQPEPEQSGRPETAREAVKAFIRPYVLDGWTLQEIGRKQPRTNRDEYAAQVGGGEITNHRNELRTISREQVCIIRVGDTPSFAVFDLAEIIAEIRDEQRGYQQQSLVAIFTKQEQEERERAAQEPVTKKRVAVYRSYMGGFCRNPACNADLGHIETEGGRNRLYCNEKCRVAAHRARQREQKRAEKLQYHGELRDYWHLNGIRGEVLLRLQEILLQHGKAAARAATDAVLVALAASEQAGNNEQVRLIDEIMLEGEAINFEEIQFDDFRIAQGLSAWAEFVSYSSTSQLRQLRGYLYERQQHQYYQKQGRKRLEELSSDLQP